MSVRQAPRSAGSLAPRWLGPLTAPLPGVGAGPLLMEHQANRFVLLGSQSAKVDDPRLVRPGTSPLLCKESCGAGRSLPELHFLITQYGVVTQ